MNKGFTTGSCAAAAAKAAAIMIFENRQISTVSITTPAGVIFTSGLEEVMLTKDKAGNTVAKCAVRKPKCDDPDVTAGMHIFAKVSLIPDSGERVVTIEGGEGIGTITRLGLDRPAGDAAINSVPRAMIEHEVLSVMEEYEYEGSAAVEISAPEGTAIAQKTFNPRLGIEGGISIIGTSGIVEPMSTKAIVDTIRVELRQHRALGEEMIVVSPGNYGLAYMKDTYGYDLDRAVKCSNFIGDTIDIAKELGFRKMLLVGHVGKLIKLSGGVFNTHSDEGDRRMELMAEAAEHAGADNDTVNSILECVYTEEAYAVMKDAHIERRSFAYVMERISHYLIERAGDMQIECIVYSNKYGLLGETENAQRFMQEAIDQMNMKG